VILVASAQFQIEKVRIIKIFILLSYSILLGKIGPSSSSMHQKKRKTSSNVGKLLVIFLLQLILSGTRRPIITVPTIHLLSRYV
jgi:hypothetical protein